MKEIINARTHEQLSRHLNRCNNCQNTISFCYRPKSYNTFEIIRSYFFCSSYFCEKCALKKRIKLRRKLKTLRYAGDIRFLTLTLSTENHTPEQAVEYISQYFNTFVKLMRYRGFKFQFFKIIELTENNLAHLHVLINCFIPKILIKLVWKNITGAYICSISAPKNKKHVINYLLKYISKSVSNIMNTYFFLQRKRRYSYSQNFFNKTIFEDTFIQSRVYFYDELALMSCVNNFFRNHFNNYNLIDFIQLN